MAYYLQAIIANSKSLSQMASYLELPAIVQLPCELAMAPLDEHVLDAIAGAPLHTLPTIELRDGELPHLEALAEILGKRLSTQRDCGVVAYVSAEYWGGAGQQGAAAWRAGELVLPPRRADGAINQALRLLGVKASGSLDEFDTVRLGRYRSTEEWLLRERQFIRGVDHKADPSDGLA